MVVLERAFMNIPMIRFFTDMPEDAFRLINGKKIIPQHMYMYGLVFMLTTVFLVCGSLMVSFITWHAFKDL